jgi:RNAse (barnase) inhibitor barstar
MSGLAALIAGREPAGVYRWVNAADVDDLRHAVEHAGLGFAHVDGWVLPDREAVLAAFGETLAFPAWYGVNLDALADCLADVAEPYVVVWDGWSILADADPGGFRAVAEIFAERAPEAPHVSLLLRSNHAVETPGREVPELT